MEHIAPSLETLHGIIPAPGIGFLIALFLPIIAFLLYFQFRPIPPVPLPSKSKSDTMASVLVPPPTETKAFPSTRVEVCPPPVVPKTVNLLDEFPDSFDFPTLLPCSALSTLAREPIIREVHPRSDPRARRECGRWRDRDRSSRRVPSVSRLINIQGSPIYLGSESTGNTSTPELIPVISGDSNNPAPLRLQLANPHDWLRWAVNGSTVFDDRDEEIRASRLAGNIFGQERLKNNMFFQWGLRYVPPLDADNFYRAVVIEDLPLHVALDQILPRIRGGQIYSASLFNTTPATLTGSPTAMITFVNQDGALAFLHRVAREGFYVGFAVARVRPVSTPTYLMSGSMENGILRGGRTRCLVISSRHPMIKKSLYNVLTKSPFSTHVECFGEHDGEGAVTVRFHSIKVAMLAYEFLMRQSIFKGIVEFDTDPCSAV